MHECGDGGLVVVEPSVAKPLCKCPYEFACYCNPRVTHTIAYDCGDVNSNQLCIFGSTKRHINQKQFDDVVRSVTHKRPFVIRTKSEFLSPGIDVRSHQFTGEPCFREKCAVCGTENKIQCEGATGTRRPLHLKHYTDIPPTNARMDYLDACINYHNRANVSVFLFDNVFSRCQNKYCSQILVLDHASIYCGDSTQKFLCCKKHFRDPNPDESVCRTKSIIMEQALIYPFAGKFRFPNKKRHILLDPCMFYICKQCTRFTDRRTGLSREVVVAGCNDDEKHIPPKCNSGHPTVVSNPHQIDSKLPCKRCDYIARAYANEPCGSFIHKSGMTYFFYCKSIRDVTATNEIELPIMIEDGDREFESGDEELVYLNFATYECMRCKREGKPSQLAFCYACLFWHNYNLHWTYWNVTSGSLDLTT